MSGPKLISLIVCSAVTPGPPFQLFDLRRQWAEPPQSLWLVADLDNPTEQRFSWDIQVIRRGVVLDHFGETLELASRTQLLLPAQLTLSGAEARIYWLHWLLNGEVKGRIAVDFGFPEAAP